MSRTNQLSITAQIALVLGSVLFFSIIMTLVGFLAANQERQKIAAFVSEPVVVTGTITSKRIDSVRPTAGGIWVYWLDVAFRTEDRSTRNQSTQVANSIFDRLQVGGPVKVTYVRSKPEWFYVPGDEPTERSVSMSVGMQKYGTIAGIVSALGLIGMLFKGRGGGTPADGIPAPRLPTSAPARPMSSQSRANFGNRRMGN